jgi:Carboxypeptidase regulatory-like domain
MPKAACYLSTMCVRLLIVQLVVCCLIASAAAARSEASKGILDGDVADAIEGAPISSAFVLIHRGGGSRDTVVRLEPSGKFQLPLTPGRYDIFIAADGFVPTCKVVEIVSDQTTQFSPRLRADVEHAEQSSH